MSDNQKEKIVNTIKMLKKQLDQIQDDVPESTDDHHRLFLYFIGSQFESLLPSKLRVIDGKGDQKIDFYYVGEDRFVAYQCKLPDLDLLEKEGKIKTFGPELINEAEDILTFLTDDSGIATGNQQAQEARNRFRGKRRQFQETDGIYKLEVVIAFFGKLTTPAEERLEELRKLWNSENQDSEILINTIDFHNIDSELNMSVIVKDRPKKIKLNYKNETQVHTNEWGYALVPAKQFYDLFENHKMALFDLNVRYYLNRSFINKGIIETLLHAKTQKTFHLLNNGITISCTNWQFNENEGWFSLTQPQIINGCQTTISIYRAYNQIKEESTRRSFEEKCLVPVRIIKTNQADLLCEIVTASNNQNKMSPRNLRSNDRAQRNLHKKFDQLKYRWFYERKDGEFESSKTYAKNSIKNYQYKSGFRSISNDDVAKSWLAFIGFSKDASERINAFDLDSERYEWLFEKCPNTNHWNLLILGPQVRFLEENFESLSPSPEHYLLSYIIFEFVKAYLVSPQANKKQCEDRLVKSGRITQDSSDEDKKKFMMTDSKYVINQILYNMKAVIVELYVWILVKAYGDLNEETVKKIFQLPGFYELFEKPDFKDYVELLSMDSIERQKHILFTGFEFIRDAVGRWKGVNESKYLSASRRIRFLHSSETVENMKSFLEKANEDTAYDAYQWKPSNVKYIESIPRLNGQYKALSNLNDQDFRLL